ncbi:type I restriction-modification system subunit M [Hydrogenovibrio crunogenus]|uniref:site-specific DNA-methyltransferase (adenine-specific) n=1 Tax=Hydrogenovibrio crunogenus TaxID=39765 RepID=A0A4V1C917_9GAMM|nr:class I SAM-dependent DNA methyltransferase [Hydrogenovibrio crunogenus]QBZ83844.1 type I restriction-modification system subunit M [Hydrogenovibrio crunogenus]
MSNTNFSSIASFIWSVADLLRGDYKQADYGKVILPFTLLRRLECVLEPTKQDVIDEYEARKHLDIPLEAFLTKKSGQSFYNTSPYNLASLLGDPNNLKDNLEAYINDFSANTREIFERYKFIEQLDYLDESDLLFKVVEKFTAINLKPEVVTNHDMGLIFEELIRRFAEASNETAGEHFTPRDIVRLTTSLLFSLDDDVLTRPGIVRSLYDPTAGTGGFLSSGSEYIHEMNEQAKLVTFGQELNPESYAICKADMLIKGQPVENIKYGNTLSDDQLDDQKFDYMLSNPPFGVEWKKVEKAVKDEHTLKGYEGRFGPGLPRVSDGSLLFLMHLISKMRPAEKADKANKQPGSRIGIILNGSPLFTGGAGSGESEIRRYVLENDLLEAIIALPTDMFFNTGIATYIWILSNHKTSERKGKVQLINATAMSEPMRKSLGSKRKQLNETHIKEINRLYGDFEANITSKVFDTTDFGFRRITVERPLQLAFYPHDENRLAALQADKAFEKLPGLLKTEVLDALKSIPEDELLDREIFKTHFKVKLTAAQFKLIQKHISEHNDNAVICTDKKGNPEPNPDLRDYENIPLKEDIQTYFEREVLPHVPDAWIDQNKTDDKDGKTGIVGYEIPFNRHFYEYTPPRALEEIDADLDAVTADILKLLNEVHA